VNSSDLDFCTHRSRSILLYSWETKMGVERLARAAYEAGMESFLKAWFPCEEE
jgi:hypothetical protein